jgi:hypothetical protein
MQDGLYVITYIQEEYHDEAFLVYKYHDTVFFSDIINGLRGITDKLTISEMKN